MAAALPWGGINICVANNSNHMYGGRLGWYEHIGGPQLSCVDIYGHDLRICMGAVLQWE